MDKQGNFVCVELFSGNADITKRLNEVDGVICYSFDWEPSFKPHFVKDLSKTTYKELCKIVGSKIDFIWASPDCTTYSVAAQLRHRYKGGSPKSDYAFYCDALNANLWSNVLLCSGVPFIVENPRGFYRSRPFAAKSFTRTVLYSTYGAETPKPTDLFFNDFSLNNYINFAKDNFRCPRTFKKGVNLSNKHGFLSRCKMPPKLLDDLADYVSFLRDMKKKK